MTPEGQPVSQVSLVKSRQDSNTDRRQNTQDSAMSLSAEAALRQFEYMYQDFCRPF